MRNTAWREEYGPKTRALVQKHGGKVLASLGSSLETLEGDAKLPSGIVLLELPSLAHAKAWYPDPDYAPMITLRQTGADAHIIVVEGI
jgi:uncharacterized protein (DUF1330 family)